MPKTKRTYFFEMFGKTTSGRMHEDIPVWDYDGDKRIIRLKQCQSQSNGMKILWYTLDGSKWLAMEWGKRTQNGIERKDFYYL